MKIDREKLGKMVRSKKAVAIATLVAIALAVLFFVLGMFTEFILHENAGVLKAWSYMFVMMAFAGMMWVFAVLDDPNVLKKQG